jgi:hypothetical protein
MHDVLHRLLAVAHAWHCVGERFDMVHRLLAFTLNMYDRLPPLA